MRRPGIKLDTYQRRADGRGNGRATRREGEQGGATHVLLALPRGKTEDGELS